MEAEVEMLGAEGEFSEDEEEGQESSEDSSIGGTKIRQSQQLLAKEEDAEVPMQIE